MAPELIFTAEANPYVCVDPRAVDYWSLGCVLYELITDGKYLPFGDSNRNKPEFRLAVLQDEPRELRREENFSGWPKKLIEATVDLVFRRLLIKDPERRLSQCNNLLDTHPFFSFASNNVSLYKLKH